MATNTLSELELEAKKLRFEKDSERAIQGAQTRLIIGGEAKHAFFAMLAMRLKMKPCWDIQTADVDGRTMRYNPEFIASLKKHQVVGLLCHEIMHCASKHHTRRGARDPRKWNEAADLAINDILIEAQFELPPGGLVPGQGDEPYCSMPKCESSEWYYNQLPDKKDGDGDGDPGKCGGVRDAGDPSSSEKSDAEWQVAVAQAESIARQRGALPGSLQRAANDLVRPVAPWREILRRFVCSEAKNDYSWFPPNRRFIHMGLYMPSVRSEDLGTVVVAFDTSGSTAPFMDRFATELADILGLFHCKLRIVYHDVEVAGEQEWCSSDGPLELKPMGGGGTSHVPVFEYIEEIDEPVSCVICLTDGYTIYPECSPSMPVLWAMVTDENPPWGDTVRIEED